MLAVVLVLSHCQPMLRVPWQQIAAFYFFGTLCYLLPLVVGVVVAMHQQTRLTHHVTRSGWCTVIVTTEGDIDLLVSVVGYDMWILLNYRSGVPFLYIAIRLHVRNQVCTAWVCVLYATAGIHGLCSPEQLKHSVPKERLKSALQAVDTKFTLIPVAYCSDGSEYGPWMLTVIYDYAQIPVQEYTTRCG